jgi:hypothetical protein
MKKAAQGGLICLAPSGVCESEGRKKNRLAGGFV